MGLFRPNFSILDSFRFRWNIYLNQVIGGGGMPGAKISDSVITPININGPVSMVT